MWLCTEKHLFVSLSLLHPCSLVVGLALRPTKSGRLAYRYLLMVRTSTVPVLEYVLSTGTDAVRCHYGTGSTASATTVLGNTATTTNHNNSNNNLEYIHTPNSEYLVSTIVPQSLILNVGGIYHPISKFFPDYLSVGITINHSASHNGTNSLDCFATFLAELNSG